MAGCTPYTQEELDRILDSLDSDLQTRVLFKLGLTTGFRVSELLSIRVSDILNPDGSTRSLIRLLKVNTKGKRGSRELPMSSWVRQDLVDQAITSDAMGKDFIFSSRQSGNNPMHRTQAWRRLKKYSHSAGVWDTGTHRLRKTFALRMYEHFGENIEKTRKVLGHKTIEATRYYLEFPMQDTVDAIEDIY
jgi:integrase